MCTHVRKYKYCMYACMYQCVDTFGMCMCIHICIFLLYSLSTMDQPTVYTIAASRHPGRMKTLLIWGGPFSGTMRSEVPL